MSRPSRARGLKRKSPAIGRQWPLVAPLAGAWIETEEVFCYKGEVTVAPLAGAWIETGEVAFVTRLIPSRPSRARGLKQEIFQRKP